MAYKRTKRQGLSEAQTTGKLEKQQKFEVESKRRQKQPKFQALVLQHGNDFKEYQRNNVARLGRLHNAIMNHHTNLFYINHRGAGSGGRLRIFLIVSSGAYNTFL